MIKIPSIRGESLFPSEIVRTVFVNGVRPRRDAKFVTAAHAE